VFLSRHKGFFYVTTKLAASHKEALAHAFAEPSGYGLGKSGWVTCKFAEGDAIPVELLLRFIDESFRLIAPKRVLAELAEGRPSVPARPAKARSPQKAAPKKRKST
jgi:hypothetical protein